jgi:hypothetical protein
MGCLEGGSGKKPADKGIEKERKMIHGKYKCPNCGALGHRKDIPKCPLNSSKKRQVETGPSCQLFLFPSHDSHCCISVQEKEAKTKLHKRMVPKRTIYFIDSS